ncbi:hypothetical protein [Sphingomonas humi]|uniref:Uncharacterized protein n=1 Tax=Sphingomonas humi TaxID=335630 RepID=A0ABP7RFS1_9SPHN
MTRTHFLILAAAMLGVPGAALAQTSTAPANVVAPAPPPREGTVGPEQLRDFSLPGTRTAPAPAAETPRASPAPPPVARTVPTVTAPTRATTPRPAEPRTDATPPTERRARTEAQPAPTISTSPLPLPPPTASSERQPAVTEPTAQIQLPPVSVTQAGSEDSSSLLPAWWPWALVAGLAGVGLALLLRQRRRAETVGGVGEFERVTAAPAAPLPLPPEPAAPPPPPAARPAPARQPQPAPPNLPTGMVTTRLRSAAPMLAAPPPVPAPAVTGGVVSRRLRAWIELDLVVREILYDADQALFRVDLIVGNGGTAPAGDITLEAVAVNAGEQQGAELSAFFERPCAAAAAMAELSPLAETRISHELRFPRAAIQAYESQGRPLFVPVVAFTAVYRTAAGEGRTGAAFLVGRDVPGSDRLAPLLLPDGEGRALGLAVRRLDEAVRR